MPFSHGDWADSDFDDDAAPRPDTAVSAPAGTIAVANTDDSVRYAMVLVDVSNVKVSTSAFVLPCSMLTTEIVPHYKR